MLIMKRKLDYVSKHALLLYLPINKLKQKNLLFLQQIEIVSDGMLLIADFLLDHLNFAYFVNKYYFYIKRLIELSIINFVNNKFK